MLVVRTLKVLFLVVFMTGIVVVCAHSDADVQAKIDNAMSAAPHAIADNATILDNNKDENGAFIVLRKGTNEWTCFPDWEGSPGNDPVCMDPTFMKWNDAFAAGKDPEVTSPGLAYMLQGGSDASNTDPFAMEPAEGEDWLSSPPHVMILLPGKLDTTVFSTDHESGGPYIMWAGTPYEHIMMPIADMEHSHQS